LHLLLDSTADLFIPHGAIAAIGFGLVTTNGAIAAIGSLGVLNGDFPLAEAGDFTLHQGGLIGAMNAVTGFAYPSLGTFVDMLVVQVLIAIAETGEFTGALIQKRTTIVAAEAQSIIGFVEGGIKLFGIILLQQHPVFCSVGVVTQPAFAFLHRLMLKFGRGHHLAHGIVATDTEALRLRLEQTQIAIAVRIVTAGAAFFESGMLDGRIFGLITNIRMTEQAEGIAFFGQHKSLWAAVWTVASDTAFLNRRMNMGHLRQSGLVIVTHVTKFVAGGDQLGAGIGGMDIVTI